MTKQTLFEVIQSDDYLVLDTETTGLHNGAEICQIAVIESTGEVLLDTLVKPVNPIPAEATRIHGITNEMVANAPAFPLDTLYEMLFGRQVIVYNVDYDVSMLYSSVDAASLFTVDWWGIADWHCAMRPFAEIYGEWNEYRQNYKWQSLSTACKFYKIPITEAHSALADCISTLAICRAMAAKESKT